VWRISNSEPCRAIGPSDDGERRPTSVLKRVSEAIHRFGPLEILNTDQGSQFISFLWTDLVKRGRLQKMD